MKEQSSGRGFQPASATRLFLPHVRINGQRNSTTCGGVIERAMMVECAVTQQPGEHRQCTRSEDAIDERFLVRKCLRCRAARKGAFAHRDIHDRGKQFRDRAEPGFALAVYIVERLTENELAVAGTITDVQPVPDVAPRAAFRMKSFVHLGPGCPRIDAADDYVKGVVVTRGVVLSILREEHLFRSATPDREKD